MINECEDAEFSTLRCLTKGILKMKFKIKFKVTI